KAQFPAHVLLPPLQNLKEIPSGAACFKIKVATHDLSREESRLVELTQSLKHGVLLRLDYNSGLSPDAFIQHVRALGSLVDLVEFFEDPVPYDARVWSELSESLGVRLALDRAPLAIKMSPDTRADKGTAPFTYCVSKPVVEDSSR